MWQLSCVAAAQLHLKLCLPSQWAHVSSDGKSGCSLQHARHVDRTSVVCDHKADYSTACNAPGNAGATLHQAALHCISGCLPAVRPSRGTVVRE
jgi:hypothetical protein